VVDSVTAGAAHAPAEVAAGAEAAEGAAAVAGVDAGDDPTTEKKQINANNTI
jgi:hypothetical protein